MVPGSGCAFEQPRCRFRCLDGIEHGWPVSYCAEFGTRALRVTCKPQKAPRLLGDIAEIGQAAALADDVEQIAMLTRGGIGPIAGSASCRSHRRSDGQTSSGPAYYAHRQPASSGPRAGHWKDSGGTPPRHCARGGVPDRTRRSTWPSAMMPEWRRQNKYQSGIFARYRIARRSMIVSSASSPSACVWETWTGDSAASRWDQPRFPQGNRPGIHPSSGL